MMEEDKEKSNSISESSAMVSDISSFEDLRKPTLSETYRNLANLVAKVRNENVTEFREFIPSKSPLPLFDECLMLTIIDRLQLEKEVTRILLSQNDQQIRRILQCKWFFKSLPLEFCSSELFPHVSLSLRCKIINKLSKHLEDETEAEKYFTFVRKNYENHRADYLLPRCSSQFILSHFEKPNSMLSHPAEVRILLGICRRYPQVGLHILDHVFSLHQYSSELGKYRNIVQYMAGNHHDLFVPFLRKHHSLLEPETLGRKVTKKLGKEIGRDFLTDEMNVASFKPKVLFLMLSLEERVQFLAKVLRHGGGRELSLTTWTNNTGRLCEYLKKIKPENRLGYIEGTFKRLFGISFNSSSKYWSRDLLEILPVETRKPFVLKMETFFDAEESVFNNNMAEGFSMRCPEEFVYLHDFPTAFGKLKEILRTTPLPSRRLDILRLMVKNCSINSDLEGLQQVVDFVVTRHRNDDYKILYKFIELILSEFPRSPLTSRTFQQLEQLFRFCFLRTDLNPPHTYDICEDWTERYLGHLIDSDVPIDTQLRNYFDYVVLTRPYGTLIVDYNGRHSKTLLVKLCGMAVEWLATNTSDAKKSGDLLLRILETCERYRKMHPKTRIWREVPGLEEMLVEKLKMKYKVAGGEEWPLEMSQKYFYEVTDTSLNPRCIQYVLTRKPEIILTYLEGIVYFLARIEYSWYYRYHRNCFRFLLKLASFYDRTDAVKDLLLKEFNTGDSFRNRKGALILYSLTATIEEFTKAIQEYLPREEQIDINSDTDFSKMHLVIPTLIRNVRPRWRNFDLIFKFFRGDYLKRIMPSLNACAHFTRVDFVVPFLKQQLDSLPPRVSYQKDIIRLIAQLSTREDAIDFCFRLWQKHSHYTIRTILLHFVSKLFLEQPTREGFDVVKKCIGDSDPVVIERMPNLEAMPEEYVEEYVDELMRFSERQPVAFRNDFQRSVLSHFHGKRIKLLSSGFAEEIIRKHLFEPKSELDVMQFACFYLTEGHESAQHRVRTTFDIIRQKQPPPREVLTFLETLLQQSMPNVTAFGDLFKAVLDNWPEYPPGVLYEKRLMFTYCSLYQKASQKAADPQLPAAEFAEELLKLYSGVDDLRDVVVIFGKALQRFLCGFGAPRAVSMVRELVSRSKDRNVGVLGIWALPEEAMQWLRTEDDPLNQSMKEQKEMLGEVLRMLESYGDAIVEIYLMRKFYGGE